MKWVICLSLLLTACHSGFKAAYIINPELVPYKEAFLREGAKRGRTDIDKTIDMYFIEDSEETYLGVCAYEGERYSIVIVHSRWINLNETSKEILMFHELGHCLLNKDHDERIDAEGYPTSMMHRYLLSHILYSEHREYYLNELFR